MSKKTTSKKLNKQVAASAPPAAVVEKWYNIRNRVAASGESSAEVLIYGDIGDSWWGDSVLAKDFVQEIAALDVDSLNIRINSFGGSVSDGLAIHNAIARHKAKTTATIDGVAYSIASLIAMAADSLEMAENALLMIHAPWGGTSGNSNDLRDFADTLDTYAAAMSGSYATKSGKSTDDIMALLTDGVDHYYTAADALAEGFIDSVVSAMPIAASFNRDALASRYKEQNAAVVAQSSKEITMTTKATNTPAAPAQAAATEAQIKAAATVAASEAVAEESTRRTNIKAAFNKFESVDGVNALMTECETDVNCSFADASSKLLAHLGKSSESVAGSHVVITEDSRDKFRTGAEASVLARANMGTDDRANHYRGYSMMDFAREALAVSGIDVRGKSKMDVVAAAFTSGSDFPLLLANVAEKAMLKGYDESEETFQQWTSVGQLGDFKPGKRLDLNSFPALDKVAEGAEYKYAQVGERGETVQLATYGKLFAITRQAIINDDLDAFSKIPRKMGRAAIRTIGDLVYAILTGNPKMADNVALFHATHKNLRTAAVPSTSSVDAMITAMATQKDGKANLNIRLAHLLVPLALRGSSSVVRNSEFEVGATTKNNTVPNSVRDLFDVIADARLDAASATGWYGAADSGITDTVEVQYLDGIQTPTLEQQGGWEIDGVEFKVRIDAGVKALDFRTMQKNAGA